MAEQDTEQRVSALEREVAELKQKIEQMLAERQAPDDLRSEVKNVNKTVVEFSAREEAHENYVRARFGIVDYDLKSINADIKTLQSGQQELRESVQALQAGQQQIIEMLMGKPRRND